MKNNLFIFSIINLILVIIPISTECVHASLDDDLMLLITSGAYTGSPSPYIIYSNYLYGVIISTLYQLYNKIEWYSVVQYILHMAAINIIILRILQNKFPLLLKTSITITILLIAIHISISLQYTFLASEISLASIALTLYQNKRKYYTFGFILFTIAASIRLTGALIPFMLFLPLLILPIHLKEKSYQYQLKYYIILIICVITLFTIDKIIYTSTPSWKTYIQYNEARQYINDNYSAKNCINLFTNENKKKEIDLLVNYRVADGTILNTTDLEKIIFFLKSQRLNNIKNEFWGYYYTYNYSLRIILLTILFTIFVLGYQKKYRYKLIIVGMGGIAFIIANAYLMSRSRAKEPVILCLIISIIAACYICIIPNIKQKFQTMIASLLICFLGVWIVCNILHTYETIKTNIAATKNTEQLFQSVSDRKILVHNGTATTINMFHVSQSIIGQKFLRTGWLINSPHTKIFYTGLSSSIENNLPHLINIEYKDKIETMKELLKDYYHMPCSVAILASSNNKELQIIKFKTK